MFKYFINISPPKTATTYLYNCLVKTDRFDFPTIKESKFLLENLDFEDLPSGLSIKSNNFRGFSWYKSIFKNNNKIKLDFTTLYNLNQNKINLEGAYSKDIVFLYIVRDPFQRLISHYYQYSKMGIKLPPIEKIFNKKNKLSDFFESFISSERLLKLYQSEKIILIDFNDVKNKNTLLKDYLNKSFEINDFDFFEIDKYQRGDSKYGFISKFLFNNVTARIASTIPNFIYPYLIQLRKKIIKLNTTKPKDSKDDFFFTKENCCFYQKLINEQNYQNTLKYLYK